jgi:hypothetical protein
MQVNDCGKQLEKLDGPEGKEFVTLANSEMRAERSLEALTKAAKASNFKQAADAFNAISDKSRYYKEAKDAFDAMKKDLVDNTVADLNLMTKDCAKWNGKARQVELMYGRIVADEAKAKARKCEKPDPVEKKPCDSCKADEKCENNKCVKKATPTTDPCSDTAKLDEIERKAEASHTSGASAQALVLYEQVLRCRPSVNLHKKAYLMACYSKQFAKARAYFLKTGQENLAQICMKEGYDPRSNTMMNTGQPP